MIAPLPPGTPVFSRYRVVGLAGQGEFGLTYLAQDQKRFDELCILKEFVPLQQNSDTIEVARQHFHREAAVLYDLQHSQLPHYRIMFSHESRLYLVREYIVGKSYSALLHERQQEGRSFSEAEVMRFLLQTLPALMHLHCTKLVHENLSLQTIVARQQDGLPVLIDLGLVKRLVAKLGLHSVAPNTPVGHVSYLSPEQQNRKSVSPGSDLYGLGAIAIALLTGKDPQEPAQRWLRASNWETQTSIHPDFARVLKRLLHPNPQKRFSSAAPVLRSLQPIADLVLTPGFGSASLAAPHLPASPATPGASSPAQFFEAASSQAPMTPPQPPVSALSFESEGRLKEPFQPPADAVSDRLKPLTPRTRSQRVKEQQPRTRSKADFKASAILVMSVALLISVVSFRALSWVHTGQDAPKDATPASTPAVSPNSLVETPAPTPTASVPTREPNSASPNSAEASSTSDRSVDVTSQFVSDLTDDLFYSKHPNLQGQKLNADQKDLQAEWKAIAKDTSGKLESLSPQTRAKLGSYQRADYERWVAPGSGASLNSRELNVLVNNRFAELFPEQKGKTLNPKTFGQVWYALAEEELNKLKP